ncbi:MAG: hypothetical protein DRQ37_00625 [Gammaproteobacteria bacterium]|nr:MAG: hypothetical protein DRQ37_00625 [Gammaproteobacteria bacterium]
MLQVGMVCDGEPQGRQRPRHPLASDPEGLAPAAIGGGFVPVTQPFEQFLSWMQETLAPHRAQVLGLLDGQRPDTLAHQQRVARLGTAIARALGRDDSEVAGVCVAGLLHDCGMEGAAFNVFDEHGVVADMQERFRQHPVIGYKLLKESEFPWPIAQIVRQHHERLDGSGWPAGLSGTAILPEAQLVAIADVFDAIFIIHRRKPARGVKYACEELQQQRGVKLNAEAVDACIGLFQAGFAWEPERYPFSMDTDAG